MRTRTIDKYKIFVNIGIDIAAIVFTIFLSRYNKVLYEIQSNYSSKIEQSWHIVGEPRFFRYLIGGALFALVLVLISLWDYRSRYELGVATLFVIVVNIAVLIALIVVYSNPVFTAFVVVLSCVGVAIGALGNS